MTALKSLAVQAFAFWDARPRASTAALVGLMFLLVMLVDKA